MIIFNFVYYSELILGPILQQSKELWLDTIWTITKQG
jgi:hypothetical protein